MDPIVPQNLAQCTFDFDGASDQPDNETISHIDAVPPVEQKYWWSDLEYRAIPEKPGIYAIINTANKHFYVGSAVNLVRRKGEHLKDLDAGNHNNPHLQSAYGLYGASAFRFCIIERVEHVENLLTREQHYIDTLNPQYNIARIAGSTLGLIYSPEARAKLSAARRAYPGLSENLAKATEAARIANTGRKLSPEQREKLRGRKPTPEARARMSAAQRGRKKSPEHIEKIRAANLGRKHTPEARENMGAPKRGRRQSPEHIANNAAARRGKKVSPEHQAKATEAARIANTGRRLSPEHIAKIKATKAAQWAAKLAQQQADQPPLF